MAGAITVSTSPMNLKDTTMEEQHISLEPKGSSLPTIAPVQSEGSPVIVHKGTGIGLFGYEGSPNGMVNGMSSMDPKLQYVNPSMDEFDELVRALKLQMEDGQGEVMMELGTGSGSSNGLTPEEMESSLASLHSVAAACDADMIVLRQKTVEGGQLADCLVRRKVDEDDFLEVRVAVVGNVDAGKSTLLGVLTHGELDNGRGHARQKLFRHKHEIESGRTSSVGCDILGFDKDGKVVNAPDGHGSLDWAHICRVSSKVVTFIDLAGHEKYLKTTIFGMTGHAPDFCMLMIGANAGIIGMTKEHLGLALALNVPVFVVVTKIDMCPPNVLQETMKLLSRILKSPGCRKIPVIVQGQDDVITSATNFSSARVCPIFQVSNVTGLNLDLLTTFLGLLSARMHYNEDKPAEFHIDETYSVPGVGTVVSGTCMQGVISLNDTLLLGPNFLGEFIPVAIRGIHRKRLPVKEVRGGQTASFALKKIRRNLIRKGMVMMHPAANPTPCWEFEGDILVLHHPTTISPKYQAMVHCGSTRQTATIISMDKEHLRTGDKATCLFRFIKNPEYLHSGTRMVFREGRTKAIGNITKVFPYTSGITQSSTTPSQAMKLKPSQIPKMGLSTGRSKGRRGRGTKGHVHQETVVSTNSPDPSVISTTQPSTKQEQIPE